jgi:hypothetical protein
VTGGGAAVGVQFLAVDRAARRLTTRVIARLSSGRANNLNF